MFVQGSMPVARPLCGSGRFYAKMLVLRRAMQAVRQA
jgi:hypothetical protein